MTFGLHRAIQPISLLLCVLIKSDTLPCCVQVLELWLQSAAVIIQSAFTVTQKTFLIMSKPYSTTGDKITL